MINLYNANSLEFLPFMEANSIDSIVTDPPYELGFMGKSWDTSGIAYNVQLWRECLRVLKPGGHMLAFSGSRTYHRMVVAIEDAGFEIRDQIMWLYGQGFPKSLDVSKAIDKAAGATRTQKDWEVSQKGVIFEATSNMGKNARCPECQKLRFDHDACKCPKDNGPQTPAAQQWDGWGTALKPAHEPICVARKPLIGTVVANVLTHGTGAINIDGCRIGTDSISQHGRSDSENIAMSGRNYAEESGRTWTGRWPANVIHDGSYEVTAGFPETKDGVAVKTNLDGRTYNAHQNWGLRATPRENIGYGGGGSAARFFYCAKTSKSDRNEGLDHLPTVTPGEMTGGRDEGSDGLNSPRAGAGRTSGSANHHPTVKPTDLMRYLCRLVTPPGGTVLDPFMGSGSTGKGAVLEGFNFTGIELQTDYFPIAQSRIQQAEFKQAIHLAATFGGK